MSTTKTRYNDFDVFMAQVVEKTKEQSEELQQRYKIKDLGVLSIVQVILTALGFPVLVILAALIAIGFFGLPLEIPLFLGSPFGIAFLLIFGATAIPTIWKLYQERRILEGVKEVGKAVEKPWNLLARSHAPQEQFDQLFQEAVVQLLVTPAEFQAKMWSGEAIRDFYSLRYPKTNAADPQVDGKDDQKPVP